MKSLAFSRTQTNMKSCMLQLAKKINKTTGLHPKHKALKMFKQAF
jgi:hypothetical protein